MIAFDKAQLHMLNLKLFKQFPIYQGLASKTGSSLASRTRSPRGWTPRRLEDCQMLIGITKEHWRANHRFPRKRSNIQWNFHIAGYTPRSKHVKLRVAWLLVGVTKVRPLLCISIHGNIGFFFFFSVPGATGKILRLEAWVFGFEAFSLTICYGLLWKITIFE